MRNGECANPPADDAREGIDIERLVARLVDEPANEIEDVADPVVQFGDQQILLLLRLCAFLIGLVGQAQDHLEQRDAQAFGDLAFGFGPFLRSAFHRFLPHLEAFARGQPVAVRPEFDRLHRIASPGYHLAQFPAPQHQIISRAA